MRKLLASNAAASDCFGWSVAVSGSTAIVGASFLFTPLAETAYIFERDEGGADNWGEVKILTASDAAASDRFGWGMAVSGDIAVVGAFGEDGGGAEAGAAYVFQRDQGGADQWGQVAKPTASDAAAGDKFGFSVALDGVTAVVGTLGEDNAGGNNAGAAYVFQVPRPTLTLVKTVTNNNGGTAVVGDFPLFIDAGPVTSGVANTVTSGLHTASETSQPGYSASDAAGGDGFGWSVAVSSDTAVVGAIGEDAGGSAAGATYVFQRDQGGADNWGEV